MSQSKDAQDRTYGFTNRNKTIDAMNRGGPDGHNNSMQTDLLYN